MSRRIRDKRDRVHRLKVFFATARLGSVTRASEHLELSQPAVSLQVRELEHELGAELFERQVSGMVLTPAGERLEALAGPLVDAVDELFGDPQRMLDEAESASLRIAASNAGVTFVLPRYMRRFLELHVRVRVETVPVCELRGRLLDETVDLMFGPRDLDAGERLRYRELFTYERVVIAALDHPLAGRASVSLGEAGAYPAIMPPVGTYSRRFGDGALHALGIDIDVAVEVSGWEMLKRCVEAGIGISVVPDFVVSDSDPLSVVALDADFPAQSFGVFTLRDGFLAASARRFLEVLAADAAGEAPRMRLASDSAGERSPCAHDCGHSLE